LRPGERAAILRIVRIHEHQARELLRGVGIPVAEGEVATTPDEARAAAARLGSPAVVKAQVLSGGRGKAGGVKRAADPGAAAAAARSILGMRISGMTVTAVLVARAVPIRREMYLGITVDRSAGRAVFIGSPSGGMEIEELAARDPGSILKLPVDPIDGIAEPALEQFARRLLGGAGPIAQAAAVIRAMHTLFVSKDCSTVEINPLAELADGSLLALDAKMVFDDNALERHPEIEALRPPDDLSAEEREAGAAGLAFVGMEGDIGCVVNGAGLAMATMDLIRLEGGSPANFLDVGGSSSPEKVLAALRIVTRVPGLRAILVNIFGGITRCDDVARGIVMACRTLGIAVPMVIRLVGTNQEEGRRILEAAGMQALEQMTEAVRAAVRAAGQAGEGSA
jgi:succinyl-CoA synthetase beta subunit